MISDTLREAFIILIAPAVLFSSILLVFEIRERRRRRRGTK